MELTRYLLKLDQDLSNLVRSEKVSVPQSINNLIRLIDQWPDREIEDGQLLRDALIEKAVTLVHPAWPDFPDAAWETFQRTLELDGFVVTEAVLRRALPADVGLPTVESETIRLLQKHGLTTAKGHLDQALDAHSRGDWAAANGQIRTFFDALLDDILRNLMSRRPPSAPDSRDERNSRHSAFSHPSFERMG